MTDGQQSYSRDQIELTEAMKPFVEYGTLRYAIGIGSEISPVELEVIAGTNVVLADDFDSLLTKIEEQIILIGTGGCKGEPGLPGLKGQPGESGKPGIKGRIGHDGGPGPIGLKGERGPKGDRGGINGEGDKGQKGALGPPGPQGLPGCVEVGPIKDKPVDLVFMMDMSASLLPSGFRLEKDFIIKVIENVGPLSVRGLRTGIVLYNSNAQVKIFLNDYFDDESFKNAVSALEYKQGDMTRIDLGLKESRTAFTELNGARGSSKKVLILMTDGQQTYVPKIKPPQDYAKQLIEDGIEIYAIGMGEEIDRVELESLIPKPEYIFLADRIDSLVKSLVGEIGQALTCEGGPRGPNGRSGDDGPPGAYGLVGEIGEAGPKGEQGEPGFGPDGEKGEIGLPGLYGNVGEEGYRGPVGILGPRGPIGPKGNSGPVGPKGESGFMGIDGEKGPQGPPGEKGETGQGTPGSTGDVGDIGEEGPKGFIGDPGVLPPGNVIDDLKGDLGERGPKGEVGADGPKGRLLTEPGPIGLAGEKGGKGEPEAEFGPSGDIGPIGEIGKQGETGVAGPRGEKGDSGFPGSRGRVGTDGDPGAIGRQIDGDPGKKGELGPIGEIGPVGEQGPAGFYGLYGRKGDKGDVGKPGKQQQPIPGQDKEFKGQPGEKGRLGDAGYTGETGVMGDVILRQGLRGPKGLNGSQGLVGSIGEQGPRGPTGSKGKIGPKGLVGPDGDPGSVGKSGQPGERGKPTPPGAPGDLGDIGKIGLSGRPGLKGVKGEPGDIGNQGSTGPKGIQGRNGFPGLIGTQGKYGSKGEKGFIGPPGPKGLPGLGGPLGLDWTPEVFGHYIVRHSQNDIIPACPNNYEVMWEGYSLMYTVGNGQAHAQDLGDAGSCVQSFSTLPFLFCELSGQCKYASRNDFVYWLSGDVRNTPMGPVTNAAIEPYVSRCSVCKAPDISIAVHSQDTVEPLCPEGYSSVWDGYSFMMVAAAGKTGAGQSLSSTGSCLEQFRPQPFVECQGARGTCAFFSDKFSFWLTTIEPTREFEIPETKVLNAGKGDTLVNRVSRCKVCQRVPKYWTPPVKAPAPGMDDSSLLHRVARGIRNWLP